jgi:hypothetical protein
MLRQSAACLTLASLGIASPLQAADRYISTTGNNGNPGTLASPWLTINHAIAQAAPGDVIHVRGGVYPDRVNVAGKSGTLAQPIIIKSYAGETAIIDRTGIAPPNGDSGLLQLTDCHHLSFQGLEIRNFTTSNAAKVPAGIYISGSGTNLRISGCKVHHIEQNNTSGGDAYGIAVKGNSATAIDGLMLDGNEVYSLRTGSSESVVLNGNVTNFTVTNNLVHDCNNIGMDFIGYEGVNSNSALDRARNGVVSGNTVWNVDSRYNPAYGGNFTTGGGDASAAGIYVDGGTNIVIERNHVFACNFGVELASEAPTGFTDYITLRNNLLHRNHVAGLIMGGYDHERGNTRYCTITNNTLYENDTLASYTGQIALQFYVSNCTFKNNLVWANPTTKQMVIHYPGDNTATSSQKEIGANVVFNYNRYFCSAGSTNNLEFGLYKNGAQRYFNTLADWRTNANGLLADVNGSYGNPGFSTATPASAPSNPTPAQVTSTKNQFALSSSSAAVNAGEPSPPFVAGTTPVEKDLFGQSRIASARVDIGADEFMSAWQAWRDLYFQLPDGGTNADATDDFDSDGVKNLLEYSQGMNPTLSDAALAPSGSQTGGVLRFTYRKTAPELTYQVETSTTLVNPWSNAIPGEQTDGAGLFWRDFSPGGARFFVRLKVTQP